MEVKIVKPDKYRLVEKSVTNGFTQILSVHLQTTISFHFNFGMPQPNVHNKCSPTHCGLLLSLSLDTNLS